MDEIRILPAHRTLLPAIRDLARRTYREHQERQPWAFPDNGFETATGPNLDYAFQDGWRPLEESPNLFAAYFGDRFAGYVLLSHWSREGAEQAHYVSVEDLSVVPEFRRRGVGRALLVHAKGLSDARDWDSLNAQVRTGNRAAEALFQSVGFAPEAVTYRHGPNRAARVFPARYGGLVRGWERIASWKWVAILLAVALAVTWTLS